MDGLLAPGSSKSPWSKQLRILLPILTLGDIALLLSAHFAVGARTFVDGHAPLNMLKPHVANEDNLFSAVHRLAQSGSWLMVIIVAVLSGAWPYVKLLATLLVVWLTDYNVMTPKRAKTWLTALGTLGKWSHADICLMCLNVAAFDIDTPEHGMGVLGSLQLHIFMSLKFGALGLMIAIIISMWITTWAKHELEIYEAAAEPLADATTDRIPWPMSWRLGTAASAALVSAVLVVVGSCIPSVFVVRSGFMANLQDPEDRAQYLSVLQLVMSLGSSVDEVLLSIIAFSVTFLAPLFEVVWIILTSAFTYLGLPLLSGATRTLAEWCNNFDTMDVYLIVCVVQLLELPKAVDFNIGSECEQFKGLMNNKFLLGIVGLGDASTSTCFAIQSRLAPGFWVLLAAVVFRSAAWRVLATVPPLEAKKATSEVTGCVA